MGKNTEEACRRKVRYPDKERARIAAATMRKVGMMEPYHCRHCEGWHLRTVKNPND
ncbi:MAG: hypothetical protein ACFFFC_08580 [Candidatus Thorarchaeota archaeon]